MINQNRRVQTGEINLLMVVGASQLDQCQLSQPNISQITMTAGDTLDTCCLMPISSANVDLCGQTIKEKNIKEHFLVIMHTRQDRGNDITSNWQCGKAYKCKFRNAMR